MNIVGVIQRDGSYRLMLDVAPPGRIAPSVSPGTAGAILKAVKETDNFYDRARPAEGGYIWMFKPNGLNLFEMLTVEEMKAVQAQVYEYLQGNSIDEAIGRSIFVVSALVSIFLASGATYLLHPVLAQYLVLSEIMPLTVLGIVVWLLSFIFILGSWHFSVGWFLIRVWRRIMKVQP